MMRNLRAVFAGFVLVLALTLNAHAFTTGDTSGLNAPQQTGLCWFYYMGRWWQLPC